jgi:flagellar motility protein MotE (MotC chaperone)
MLRSPWFLAAVAVVLGVITCAATLLLRLNKISHETQVATQVAVEQAKPKDWDFWTTEMQAVASELKSQRVLVDSKAKDLDAYAERLKAEKQELVKVRTELEAMRDELEKSIPVLQANETVNVKSLAKTYSAMKPAQAVTILGEMDDQSIVKLLAVMKPDNVASIFQEMARSTGGMQARAAKISDLLRLVKKQPAEPQQP